MENPTLARVIRQLVHIDAWFQYAPDRERRAGRPRVEFARTSQVRTPCSENRCTRHARIHYKGLPPGSGAHPIAKRAGGRPRASPKEKKTKGLRGAARSLAACTRAIRGPRPRHTSTRWNEDGQGFQTFERLYERPRDPRAGTPPCGPVFGSPTTPHIACPTSQIWIPRYDFPRVSCKWRDMATAWE